MAALAADFDSCWSAVDRTAEQGTASAYQAATQALVDLSEAYTLHASRAEFDARFRGFAERHGRRTALVRRLKSVGLWR